MTVPTEDAVYKAGRSLNVSDKVMLAAFETIIVESGAKNLASRAVPESLKFPNEGVAAGDHDSVGAFQQRASWGSVASRMNVTESAVRFFQRAKAKEKATGQTAGQLAQAVQVSAFPARYDAAQPQASTKLAAAKLRNGGGSGGGTTVTTPVGFTDSVDKITDPNTWRKFGLNVLGFLLILAGFFFLAGKQLVGSKLKMVTNIAGKVAK